MRTINYQLSGGEEFIINNRRHFSFLWNYSYSMKKFKVYGRDGYALYAHEKSGMEILIQDEGAMLIYIKRKPTKDVRTERDIMFEVSEICQEFGVDKCASDLSVEQTFKWYSEFVKSHLLPVIKGEKWIDELLRDR